MGKIFKNKKVIIPIISIIIIAIIGGSIYAVNAYNSYVTEQKIEESINSIKDIYKDFKKETNRDKKIDILKSLEKEYNIYTKASNDEFFENVSKKYDSVINQMQSHFKDEYNLSVKDNTLKNLNKIKDKNKIKRYKEKLNSLYGNIKKEKGIVCSKDEVNDYKVKINKLTVLYDKRIKQIKAAEKKAKEEATAAKKAEEAAKSAENTTNYSNNSNSSYNSNSDYNNSTQNSNNSSNNSSSNSNNGNNSSSNYEWWSWTDEDGYTTYGDNKGNHWNDEGDTYNGNLDGWGVTYN